MTYEIEYTGAAARELRQLERRDRVRILDAVDRLAGDPRPPGCTRLTGVDAWRIRVGDYRVIYEIADSKLLVTVVRVGHRREVYRA